MIFSTSDGEESQICMIPSADENTCLYSTMTSTHVTVSFPVRCGCIGEAREVQLRYAGMLRCNRAVCGLRFAIQTKVNFVDCE